MQNRLLCMQGNHATPRLWTDQAHRLFPAVGTAMCQTRSDESYHNSWDRQSQRPWHKAPHGDQNARGAVLPDGGAYGKEDKELADQKRQMAKALKELTSDGHRVSQIKAVMPVLLLLTQVGTVQGLGLAAVAPAVTMVWDTEAWHSMVAMVGIAMVTVVVFFGLPYSFLKLLKWCLRFFPRGADCYSGEPDRKARTHCAEVQPKGKSAGSSKRGALH